MHFSISIYWSVKVKEKTDKYLLIYAYNPGRVIRNLASSFWLHNWRVAHWQQHLIKHDTKSIDSKFSQNTNAMSYISTN